LLWGLSPSTSCGFCGSYPPPPPLFLQALSRSPKSFLSKYVHLPGTFFDDRVAEGFTGKYGVGATNPLQGSEKPDVKSGTQSLGLSQDMWLSGSDILWLEGVHGCALASRIGFELDPLIREYAVKAKSAETALELRLFPTL